MCSLTRTHTHTRHTLSISSGVSSDVAGLWTSLFTKKNTMALRRHHRYIYGVTDTPKKRRGENTRRRQKRVRKYVSGTWANTSQLRSSWALVWWLSPPRYQTSQIWGRVKREWEHERLDLVPALQYQTLEMWEVADIYHNSKHWS